MEIAGGVVDGVVRPPKEDVACVSRMEEVLGVDVRPPGCPPAGPL